MRITNLDKGEPYELAEGAQIEVERTNPFFYEYGEQTVPVDLPASDHNRRILGYPDLLASQSKAKAIRASIQDGEYYAQCRQFVLSAKHKGNISTSFYINDGSFYSRIQNVRLKEIFADDIIQFSGNNIEAKVQSAIEECRRLRLGRSRYSDRLAIFPVLVDDDSGMDEGLNYKVINAYCTIFKDIDNRPGTNYPNGIGDTCDFYGAYQRTEYVNQVPITITPGYYISPFVKTNYVLSKIFMHFGYTLQSNFFSETEPFVDMVLLNNVIDPIVNGQLKIADLLPDVTCTEFLTVFRKKFCCEFTSDEGTRTANVIFLKDVLASNSSLDLTDCLTDEPTVEYKAPKDYKRIVLSSKKTLGTDSSDENATTYDNISSLIADNPSAYLDPYTGAFYKDGFSGFNRVKVKVADASMPYDTGEDIEAEKVEIPDCIPEYRVLKPRTQTWEGVPSLLPSADFTFGKWLYVGKYTTLNSKLEVYDAEGSEAEEDSNKLLPMLAFSYIMNPGYSNAYTKGSLSSIDKWFSGPLWNYDIPLSIWYGYALYYYGPCGIFEKFYREYDTLLRNALQTVKMNLLLPQSKKQTLPAHSKVTVRGVPFLVGKLKFILGGNDGPMECEFRSLRYHVDDSFSKAPDIDDVLPIMKAQYEWAAVGERQSVSESEYNNSGADKERTFRVIYPPVPSISMLAHRYYEQTSYTIVDGTYTRTTVYLTVVPSS